MGVSNTLRISLLVLLLAVSVAAQDTTYHQNLYGLDGVIGFGPFYCKQAIAEDGRYAVFFNAKDDDSTMFLVTSDFGDTWDTVMVTNNEPTTAGDAIFAWARGNYIYATLSNGSDVVSGVRSKTGATFERDTAWIDAGGVLDPQGRAAGFNFDTAGYTFIMEGIDEAADSILILTDGGTFPTAGQANWTIYRSLVGSRIGDGVRAFFEWGTGLGAMLAYGGGAQNSCHYIDTSVAISEAATSGMLLYDNVATAYMIPTFDSFGVWIEQYDAAAGADSIVARSFHISGAGTGSVSLVFDDTTTLDDGTDINDGSDASPTCTYVYGKDSVIAYWLYWSSTDIGIKRCVGTYSGTDLTWGTPETMRTASATPYSYLQAPQTIRVVNDTLREWLAWHPAAGTDTSIQIFYQATSVGSVANTGAQVIIIQ